MADRRIVSIGEAMVEMAPLEVPGTFRMGFAGDTLNTAWYLARLMPDWKVDYLTAAGTDGLSDRFVAFLAEAGIGTAHIKRRTDRTLGLYLIELTEGERSFAYWRGESAARTLADDPGTLTAALAGAEVAYLSGITLAILPPEGRANLLAALAAFRAKGGRVAFDPNLRPRLWSDPDTMRRAVTETAALAQIVLPSFEDEAVWFGDATPEATARRYAGADIVAVKDGPRDITIREGTSLTRLAVAPIARVVDTTAAGDSFNAGFLAGFINGTAPAEAAAQGARIAGRVIGARGALVEGAWRTRHDSNV